MESFFKHVHGLFNCLSQGLGMPRNGSFGSPSLSQRGRVGDKNNSHLKNPDSLKQACAKWHTDARVKVRKLHVSVSGNELILTQEVPSSELIAGCHTSRYGRNTVLATSASSDARRYSRPQHGSYLRAPSLTPISMAATRPTPASYTRVSQLHCGLHPRALHQMPHETRQPR